MYDKINEALETEKPIAWGALQYELTKRQKKFDEFVLKVEMMVPKPSHKTYLDLLDILFVLQAMDLTEINNIEIFQNSTSSILTHNFLEGNVKNDLRDLCLEFCKAGWDLEITGYIDWVKYVVTKDDKILTITQNVKYRDFLVYWNNTLLTHFKPKDIQRGITKIRETCLTKQS